MTPKEKAEELFVRINKEGLHQISSVVNRHVRKEMIKQCALIAVDEILDGFRKVLPASRNYWEQVKQEIEKL
jgi:hypothetical protein